MRHSDVGNATKNGEFKSCLVHNRCCGKEEGRLSFGDWYMNGYFLLKKRDNTLRWETLASSSLSIRFNERYTLPKSKFLLYSYANVTYSLLGKLKNLYFQPLMFSIQVESEDDSKKTHKGVVPIGKTGLLINKDNQLSSTSKDAKNNSIISVTFIKAFGLKKPFLEN